MEVQVASMIMRELQMVGSVALAQPVLTLVEVVEVIQAVEVALYRLAIVMTHKLEEEAGLTQPSALLHRALQTQGLDILQLV
jgi:ABC-type bacteriocin/lantibiotic exporter with double-glycine peptidase domain